MNTEQQQTHPPKKAENVDDNLFTAVKTEVKHEVQAMEHSKEPVDPTQSDVLVQKHFPGLFVILLGIIVVFLLVALAGIAIFGHH